MQDKLNVRLRYRNIYLLNITKDISLSRQQNNNYKHRKLLRSM